MNKAFALPVIHSGNGSLEQYIHTVNSIPMLTAEEETQLAERQQKRRSSTPPNSLFCPIFASSYPSHVATTATASTKPT